jgi:WWE domain
LANKITSSTTRGKLYNTNSGHYYDINFERFVQINSSTTFERSIRREETELNISIEAAGVLPPLPNDIAFTGDNKEHLLLTFVGQVIQVSKVHRSNEWLFGNVLYDPLLDDAMRRQTTAGNDSDSLQAILAQAIHDRPTSGWFPRSVTRIADVKQMH